MRLFLSFSLIFILVGCRVSEPSKNDLEAELLSQQPTFAKVIELVEQYREVKKVYPTTLNEVENIQIPVVLLPSQFKSLHTTPVRYEVSRDRSFFRLTYGISDSKNYELHYSSSYLSVTKQWEQKYLVESFAHLEANHYGALYQRNHLRKHLDLTVLSLLDAAKANNAFPCRNFWKDWVVKAIGSGQSLNRPLPTLSKIDEATVYVSENCQAAYAFAFQSKLYPPMQTPLMIVSAVYKTKNGNTEWTLVQQCDSSP